jgi:LuxR family maltose regulon positive regulatory protein
MKTSTGKLDPLVTLRRTKLHEPRSTRYLVVRHRLWEQLEKGKAHPLILVCAPAGYGKTTLVSSWIENMQAGGKQRSTPMPAAWLSLDESDSDVLLFLEYLIAALRTIFEGACEQTIALIFSPLPPSLKVITTSFINEIDQLPGSFILVLDDYQAIHGHAVHDLLDELLQRSSPHMHLVLISRNDPPLSLARLRANGMLTEIRSRDLRFAKEEATAFLSETLEITLSDSAMTKLQERLEGWIAGLRLVALSLRTADDANIALTTLSGVDTNLTDYLADEVLSRQLPAIQTFLLKTSILDQFNVELCEAVVGESDPAWRVATCIEWLNRMELFIIPLDDRKQWFRYHHLFQSLLKQRMRAVSGKELENVLHQRASAWFEEQGMLDEAIHHALEAGDLELAVQLMENGLKEVLNREDRLTLERWLHLLPEEYIQKRPSLMMIKGWFLLLTWQLGALSEVVRQGAEFTNTDGAPQDEQALNILRGQMAAFRAQELYLSNRPIQALEFCREGMAILPRTWLFVHGVIILYLGLSMQAAGHSQAAERQLFDIYEKHDNKTDGFAMEILLSLNFIKLTDGNLEQNRQVAHMLLQQATRGNLPLSKAWGNFFLGLVKYQWDELDSAEQYLLEIVDNRFNAQPLTIRNTFTILARLNQARGRSTEARQILETLSQYDLDRLGYEADETISLRARLSLLQGKMGDAFRWADSFTLPPPEQALLWPENLHATQAQILIARGHKSDLKTALSILDSLYEMADRTFNTRFKIEALALRAMALDGQGKTNKAETVLKQALDLAQPGGFIRVFVDPGQQLQVILKRLEKRDPSNDHIQCILAAFIEEQRLLASNNNQLPSAPGSAQNYSVANDLLTPREMDILMLLRGPFSNKEIANKLYLSPSTVKRHTINLYGKLGVHSRKEAVATAIKLGIFPPN